MKRLLHIPRHMTSPLCLAALVALAALPVRADYNLNGKTIDCYCTDSSGGRVELGETICLQVGGRMFMAQCQMSLNVPMWREISEGCFSSSLPQSRKPTLDPGLVDPEILATKS